MSLDVVYEAVSRSYSTRGYPLSLLADLRPLYEVHKRSDDSSHWKYNLAVNCVNQFHSEGRYYVVVYADWGSVSEKVFTVPSEYLHGEIFPRALKRDGRRFMFQVNKRTFEFTWQRGIKMDGRPFVISGD